MGRPRKNKSVEEVQDEQELPLPSEPIQPTAPAGEPERDPDEPSVSVRMQGRASKVAELMSKKGRGGGSRDDDPEATDQAPASKRKRHQALQNPRNRVFVKRIRPMEFEGRRANYEVYSEDCPLTIQMVEKAVLEQHGGGIYQAHITDRQTSDSIDAWTFESNHDPILKPVPQSPSFFEEAEEPTDAEQMDNMIALNQKRITMETLNQQLADLKGSRPQNGSGSPVLEAKIGRLEVLMAQKSQQDQIASVENKYQKMIDDLTAKVAELSKPKVEDTGKRDGVVELLLEQSKQAAEDRRASDLRFNQMFQSMQETSLNSLRAEVRELKAVPKGDESLIDQLYKAREIAKVFGSGGGDSDIEKPWYVELKEAVTTVAETVTEFIKARSANGQPVSQEEFARQFNRAADTATRNILSTVPQGLPVPTAITPVTVVPQTASAPLAGTPGGTFRSRSQAVAVPVAAKPSPVAAPRPVAPPAPRPAPTPQAPPVAVAPPPASEPEIPALPTLDDDVRSRVGNVMVVMDREMVLRPNRYTWTQYAWEEFPADLLDAIAQSIDSVAMIETIMRGVGADPSASVEQFKAKPKIVQWLNRGLADLKVWVEARNEDPNFDPFEEEEEGEPGGEGVALAPPPGVGAVIEESGGNGEVG